VPNLAQFDPLRLASLVASRLCHDLISPIGAIGNGVELMLMDSTGTTGQEMALILESTGAANARIRFFRVAFGLCGPDQRMSRHEVGTILDDITTGGRVQVILDSPNDLTRREVKLVFLGYLCLEGALPQGGTITLTMNDKGWHLAAHAARLRVDADLWSGLETPEMFDDVTPGQVHFPLMVLEAARQHRRLTMTKSEIELHLTF
jgi:histidine phosphotransferase ChpT